MILIYSIRRPESRPGKDSWRNMMVDGAMGDRRCREGTDGGQIVEAAH